MSAWSLRAESRTVFAERSEAIRASSPEIASLEARRGIALWTDPLAMTAAGFLVHAQAALPGTGHSQ